MLHSIALLVAMMLVILFVYFRRWSDVVTCLAGVTLSQLQAYQNDFHLV